MTADQHDRSGIGELRGPRPDALAAQLRWVREMLRRDLVTIKQLAVRISDGASAGEVERELNDLQTNGPLFQLRVNCSATARRSTPITVTRTPFSFPPCAERHRCWPRRWIGWRPTTWSSPRCSLRSACSRTTWLTSRPGKPSSMLSRTCRRICSGTSTSRRPLCNPFSSRGPAGRRTLPRRSATMILGTLADSAEKAIWQRNGQDPVRVGSPEVELWNGDQLPASPPSAEVSGKEWCSWVTTHRPSTREVRG